MVNLSTYLTIRFFNFLTLFRKMYIVEVVTLFSRITFIQSTKFFSGSTYQYNSVFDEAFLLLTIRMAMTSNGDIPRGAPTHKFT